MELSTHLFWGKFSFNLSCAGTVIFPLFCWNLCFIFNFRLQNITTKGPKIFTTVTAFTKTSFEQQSLQHWGQCSVEENWYSCAIRHTLPLPSCLRKITRDCVGWGGVCSSRVLERKKRGEKEKSACNYLRTFNSELQVRTSSVNVHYFNEAFPSFVGAVSSLLLLLFWRK